MHFYFSICLLAVGGAGDCGDEEPEQAGGASAGGRAPGQQDGPDRAEDGLAQGRLGAGPAAGPDVLRVLLQGLQRRRGPLLLPGQRVPQDVRGPGRGLGHVRDVRTEARVVIEKNRLKKIKKVIN